MNMELEPGPVRAAECLSNVFNELPDGFTERSDAGDLFQFLRDVSSFLARSDEPA